MIAHIKVRLLLLSIAFFGFIYSSFIYAGYTVIGRPVGMATKYLESSLLERKGIIYNGCRLSKDWGGELHFFWDITQGKGYILHILPDNKGEVVSNIGDVLMVRPGEFDVVESMGGLGTKAMLTSNANYLSTKPFQLIFNISRAWNVEPKFSCAAN